MSVAIPRPSEVLTFERWRESAVDYVEDLWPHVKLEPFQRTALEAITSSGRVSIRSGHGVGKSTLDSWAVLWFMSTHFPCKVPITAPTKHQIEDVLHAEIAKWLNQAPMLKANFTLKAERLELNGAPKESFAAFRTGNKANPEALQGFHSENIFFVLDEASGIDDSVFVVAEGALSTPGARVLMTSNPTQRSGYFYDSHHANRAAWTALRVSCEDSTQVDPSYIEGMKRRGVTSNIYRVRVLGEFPTADDDAVIPLDIVESAVDREVVQTDAPILWGLDVARFGDDRTALAQRRGNTMLAPVESWQGKDLMQTAGMVVDKFNALPPKQQPSMILVDVIGLGSGVVDRLKEQGLPVKGVNVGEQPAVRERYMRLRDEVWFRGREWFEALDVTMPDDPALIAELTGVSYRIESSGKIKVDSKEQMKRDGRLSPDLADAFLLTFCGPQQTLRRKWEPLHYKVANIL